MEDQILTKKCERFKKINLKIKENYPEAKFELFMTTSSMNRIISYNKYIIVAWLGDICCGADSEGHCKPKVYTVCGKSQDFITMDDVITTLIDEGFEVPCDFKCLEDVIPAINPLNSSESVYFYSLEMSYLEK